MHVHLIIRLHKLIRKLRDLRCFELLPKDVLFFRETGNPPDTYFGHSSPCLKWWTAAVPLFMRAPSPEASLPYLFKRFARILSATEVRGLVYSLCLENISQVLCLQSQTPRIKSDIAFDEQTRLKALERKEALRPAFRCHTYRCSWAELGGGFCQSYLRGELDTLILLYSQIQILSEPKNV